MGWQEVSENLERREIAIKNAAAALSNAIAHIDEAMQANFEAIAELPSGTRTRVTGADAIASGQEIAAAFVQCLASSVGFSAMSSVHGKVGSASQIVAVLNHERTTILAAREI